MTAVQAVGDRIASDLEFARAVYEDPKAALPGDFDLSDDECEMLYEWLSAAIDEQFGEVKGFSFGVFDGFEISFDAGIGGVVGGTEAKGKPTFNPFTIKKLVDKASPTIF